jgi:hypothetical protein
MKNGWKRQLGGVIFFQDYWPLDLIIPHGGAGHEKPGLPKKFKKFVKGIHLPFGKNTEIGLISG